MRLDLVPLLAWEMLGLKVEPVFGIKGRGDGRLMFERGGANIDYQTSSSYLKGVTPFVETGTAVPMMSWGALDAAGNIVRDPTFPEMPTFKEVCEATDGCETSGEKWDAWKPFLSPVSRPRRWCSSPMALRRIPLYWLHQGLRGDHRPDGLRRNFCEAARQIPSTDR